MSRLNDTGPIILTLYRLGSMSACGLKLIATVLAITKLCCTIIPVLDFQHL